MHTRRTYFVGSSPALAQFFSVFAAVCGVSICVALRPSVASSARVVSIRVFAAAGLEEQRGPARVPASSRQALSEPQLSSACGAGRSGASVSPPRVMYFT